MKIKEINISFMRQILDKSVANLWQSLAFCRGLKNKVEDGVKNNL